MNEYICQSCGMPMTVAEEFGTNVDQSQNTEYCVHCFQNGAFTRDVTMEEMMETNLKYIDEWNRSTGNNMTVDEARPVLREFLSSLKRWEKN